MDPVVVVVLAVVAAGVVGACGPGAVRALPEPENPAPDKRSYAEVAALPGALWWMVLPAAVGAGVVAWRIDQPELVPAWVLACGVGAWLSFVDWHTRYLPFLLTVPLHAGLWLLVGLAALLLQDHRVLVRALVANLVVFALFWLMHWLASRFFGGAFGYGDVRLAAALAVVLGPLGVGATVVGMYAGFLLGALFGVVLAALRIVDRTGFAFGPYLVAGAVIGAAWGPSLLSA